MSRYIELLAPAKGFESARVAIDYGADAVYMGGARFGARAGAANTLEEVARAVEYAHQYGARLYATLNTLIYEDELKGAEAEARRLIGVGVDALIVQDMAFARMGLGVELHASTQMCNSTLEQVQFLSETGFSRVVLERNLSLEAIREIGAVAECELEAFVHGAICVGYSGRCYLSRSMNVQRSGNRGECSQPCRLSYDLVGESGTKIVAGRHLLSVKDFNLTSRVGELLDAGVSSFKIEGRLKDLSYTKNIVAHYRSVLDVAIAEREGLCRSSVGDSECDFEPSPAKSFSRGETHYMLDGGERGVASLQTPKALGERVGRVVGERGERLELKLERDVVTGDGLCFMTRGGLVGGGVNRVEEGGRFVTLSGGGGRLDIEAGSDVYRNFDRVFEGMLERSRTRRRVGVDVRVRSNGEMLEVEYRDEQGYRASAGVEGVFEKSKSRDKMSRTIERQLSKCGDTIFEVRGVDLSEWGGEFVASSQLNSLRREALERLRGARVEGAKRGEQMPHRVFSECRDTKYMSDVVSGDVGVTNSLAEGFYRDHGVESIERSFELREGLEGERVLVSNYCIRREIGECLKGGSKLREELYLVRGGHRFRLDFDCRDCRMSLIKV